VLDAGADDFLAKPVDLDELVAVLLRLAGNRLSPRDAAAPDSTETVPRIAGIDSEQALLILGGDIDLFLKLLQRFVRDFSATVPDVREKLSRGDRQRAAELLHKFRGAAGYIGARDAAQAAETLERSILADRPDLAFRMTAFENLTSALLEGARAHFASGSKAESLRC
jgi:two-component system sensor histidine kinase/response regulator